LNQFMVLRCYVDLVCINEYTRNIVGLEPEGANCNWTVD